jgi:hypothetical protein
MSKAAENQKLLSEKQLDLLSYPEPPVDFADRVMNALLIPKVEPKPKSRSLLWLGVSAAAFGLGVASSPLLLRAPNPQSAQLQAVAQTTKTIATPAGGSNMIPIKTLGAISMLGTFLGGIGPGIEPDTKQAKKFCKEVSASCEESPAEVCSQIWAFCHETPVGIDKITITTDAQSCEEDAESAQEDAERAREDAERVREDAERVREEQQEKLEALQGSIGDLVEQIQDCHMEGGCTPAKLKKLESELDKEVKQLKKRVEESNRQFSFFEDSFNRVEPAEAPEPAEVPEPAEAPEPPEPPNSVFGPGWLAPMTPLVPRAPTPPATPNWGGSVIIMPNGDVRWVPNSGDVTLEFGEDTDDNSKGCDQCEYEQEREEALQKYQEKLDEILQKQEKKIQKELKKARKKAEKSEKEHSEEF